LFSTQCGGAIGHPGLGVRRTGPDTDKAEHGGGPETSAAFLAPGDCQSRRRICSGGLASVVLLVGGDGPVIVLVILAAGAGVALAAGAGAFAVLDVAVAAFGGGVGARAGGSAGYNTQNKPSRGCTCRMLRCTNGLLDKSSCSIRVSRSIEWCRKPIFSASTRL
jgi:hypothetical protein